MNAKKTIKRLALNRETIRELRRDELSAVAGGAVSLLECVGTLPPTVCQCTGNYTAQYCTA
jgi:natural product precursor